MQNKYKLIIYPEAQADIESALDYITLSLHAKEAAQSLLQQLRHALDNVCLFPCSCPIYKSKRLRKGITVRKLIVDNYLVFYIANEDTSTIEVLRFIYGARDLSRII